MHRFVNFFGNFSPLCDMAGIKLCTVSGKAPKRIPISKFLSKQGKTKQKYVLVPDNLESILSRNKIDIFNWDF